jgi:alginate O-acetyltransferase complex protein AlgJ
MSSFKIAKVLSAPLRRRRLPVAARGACAIVLSLCGWATADDASQSVDFRAAIANRYADSQSSTATAMAGQDGWCFFVPELRALSIGPFWGENAAKTSRASNPDHANPLPAILDFQKQLSKKGIALLIVPVPAKAAVYPEKLLSISNDNDVDPARIDQHHSEFYEILRKEGVNVLDLLPLFLEHRNDAGGPLYCKTDSHWSGRGLALAAQAISEKTSHLDLKSPQPSSLKTELRDVVITGDLALMLNEKDPTRETIPLTFVGEGTELNPVATSRTSPVLLIGDSHTLIFHDPTLFAKGAGLPDHLTYRLGTPIDLVGVRGSGATTTRIELARRRDNLSGKKLVIWCFSFREFTESTTGWRKVPVIR